MNLDTLAADKGFTVGQLAQFGLRNGQGGVLVPYRDAQGNEYIRSRVMREPTPDNKSGRWWSKGDAPVIPYGLDRPVPCNRGLMWIVEGESDCWTLWLHGIPALGIPGVQQATKLRPEHLSGVQAIAVVEESDDAGRRFPHLIATHLYDCGYTGEVYRVPLSAKDPRELWRERGDSFVEALRADYKANRVLIPPPSFTNSSGNLGLLSYDDLCRLSSATTDWLVEGLLRRSGLLLLAGRPKAGKSTLARNLAKAVALGEDFLGRRCAAGEVIWLGLEESVAELRDALEALGATEAPIRYRVEGFHGDQEAWLRAAVEQTKPALVIIDTVGTFANVEDINSYSQVVKATKIFLELRNRFGTTFCLNHHTNKANTALGSTYWEGVVDMTVVLTRNEDDSRTLKTEGKRGTATIGFDATTIQMDPESGLITGTEPKSITDRRVAEKAILLALADGKQVSREELVRAGGRRSYVSRAAIDSLVSQGLLAVEGTGAKGDPRLYSACEVLKESPSRDLGRSGTAREGREGDNSGDDLLAYAQKRGL